MVLASEPVDGRSLAIEPCSIMHMPNISGSSYLVTVLSSSYPPSMNEQVGYNGLVMVAPPYPPRSYLFHCYQIVDTVDM